MLYVSPFFKDLEHAQQTLSKHAFFLFDIHQVIFHRKGLFPFFKGFKKTRTKSLVLKQSLKALLKLTTWKTILGCLKKRTRITEAYLNAAEQFPILHEELLEFSNNIYTPNKRMKECISHLFIAGHKIYLLSNIGNGTLKKLKLDYPDYFRHLTESDNTINRDSRLPLVWKPQRKAFHQALSVIKQSENPHHAIFIDDTANNVKAAYRAGFNAIKFCTQSQFEKDLKKLLGLSSLF